MNDKKIKTIFSESLLEKIPVTYRYLVEKETHAIPELYHQSRFSQSKRHFAEQYLSYPCYKPISTICIQEIEIMITEL